jgi:hypothetical protein
MAGWLTPLLRFDADYGREDLDQARFLPVA